jgi:hypothetical protein
MTVVRRTHLIRLLAHSITIIIHHYRSSQTDAPEILGKLKRRVINDGIVCVVRIYFCSPPCVHRRVTGWLSFFFACDIRKTSMGRRGQTRS